jgi:diguanylate cyclase (GGDEF)-like protein
MKKSTENLESQSSTSNAQTKQELKQALTEVTDQLTELSQQLQTEVSLREQLENRLKHLSMHDELTGLPNRTFISEQAEQMLAQAQRRKELLCIIMINVDVNTPLTENSVQNVSDEAIIEASLVVRDSMRDGDLAGRWDKQVFIGLLAGCNTTEDTETIAQRILTRMMQPVGVFSNKPPSLSIGCACFPEHADNVDELIQRAEIAMNEVKTLGDEKACFMLFNPAWD